MSNFTPLQKPGSKTKKFNKFLIIGNLLLVVLVSITGLVYYNKTLLTTQQKAGFDCSDWSDKRKCAEERKQYEESGQADADKEAKKKKEREEKKAREEEVNAGSGCPGGFQNTGVEDSRGNIRHICCDMSSSDACYRQAANMGIDVKVTSQGGSGSGGYRCIVGRSGYTGKEPCTANNDVQDLGAGKPPSCFCGTIQIDGGEWNGTYTSSCGCNEQEKQAVATTTLVGTIIPTPTDAATPTPTATPTGIPTSTPTPTPTGVISTGTPTPTITPGGPTSTPTATPTPGPLVCATKDCNETTRPCEPGNICIKANDGSNYCSNESLVDACKSSPTSASCCKIVPTSNATPTEIILAKTSISPTVVAKLLETGVVKSFMYLVPAAIVLIGLIL